MMIPGTCRFCALGALLAALAAPSLAAAPRKETVAAEADAAPAAAERTGRSRRLELPFPRDFSAPAGEPRVPHRREVAPHPFREGRLKRAALAVPDSGAEAINVRRLSRFPEFS
jgi:hypothetical protein